jgi:two-component system, OmpR family, sensor histidine kinase VicK
MTKKLYIIRGIKNIGKLSTDGVFVFNVTENKLDYCNKAFTKILEVSKATIENNNLQEIVHRLKDGNDLLQRHFKELESNARIANVELRVVAKNEKYISCEAYYLKNENVIVGFIKDITHQKEHINYITEFGARKDAILDMVVHNLSGPLNMTNNLLNLVDQLSPAKHHKIDYYTRIIRENTQQCIEIINSFLKEEHLASEKIFVYPKLFDVVAKVNIIVARLREFDKDKEINVVSDLDELFVNGDDVKFFQVIHNIVSNSLKFTPPQGRITIEIKDLERFFTVSVKDNGIGIPEHLQPHIFKKNTPASRTGLKGERSIGMGLYIVKKLVGLMKGKINLKTEEKKGTTFTVQFPKG